MFLQNMLVESKCSKVEEAMTHHCSGALIINVVDASLDVNIL